MALCALLLTAIAVLAQAPPAENGAQKPFHDFRSQELQYSGPANDTELAELSEVAIGWFGPDDPTHPLHGDLWAAASMAIEEVNRDGGVNGLPVRLRARWSESPWGTGAGQIARMVYEDETWAILGSVDGASTHLAEQIAAKARLPLVSPVSTDVSVNLAGVPWMFSVAPADHLWAPVLAQRLIDAVADRSFALITVTDHDSRLTTETLLDAVAELDRVPSYRLDLKPGTDELDTHLQRLEIAKSTTLLLVADAIDGARLLRALRTSGFSGTVFGTPSLARRSLLELAGPAAEGLRLPLLWAPDSKTDRNFEQRFLERTGSLPDWAAAHTYDATHALLDAIERADRSRAAIRQALADLSPWQGVTGTVRWDPTGQNTRQVTAMATVREGRLVAD